MTVLCMALHCLACYEADSTFFQQLTTETAILFFGYVFYTKTCIELLGRATLGCYNLMNKEEITIVVKSTDMTSD